MREDNHNPVAERKVITKLVNEPNLIFDIENNINADDFGVLVSGNIFRAVKEIAATNSNIKDNSRIDPAVLEEKIAILFPSYYNSQSVQVKDTIKAVYGDIPPSNGDFISLVKIVLNNSIKRRYLKRLETIKQEVANIDSPDKLANHIECSTVDFTSSLFRSNDICVLGSEFDHWLARKQKEVAQGKVHVGISTGFPNYDTCIGGGYRDGTINVIAARSKMGKSWLALTIANHVSQQGIPVLYLDTELDDEYQTVRRVAQMTKIPIQQIELGKFIGDAQKEVTIRKAVDQLKKDKIHYIEIKGWGLEDQISIVRRFFAKIVGRVPTGERFNRCLVILDYLKLMTAKDKNSDKEWEALGYRMTALHDLMGEYKSPMLALAQQNRDGLEKEDESTISGSDRIIWLCDSFSIFSRLDDTDIQMRIAAVKNDPTARKPANCKIKVVDTRHGIGTKGRKFIGMYGDIHDPNIPMDGCCGIIEERSIETITVTK